MTPPVSVTDRMRSRTVRNQVKLIHEILEAMQRDSHGIEAGPWKREADHLWKSIFEQVNRMSPEPQRLCLEMIREPWTTYATHYASVHDA